MYRRRTELDSPGTIPLFVHIPNPSLANGYFPSESKDHTIPMSSGTESSRLAASDSEAPLSVMRTVCLSVAEELDLARVSMSSTRCVARSTVAGEMSSYFQKSVESSKDSELMIREIAELAEMQYELQLLGGLGARCRIRIALSVRGRVRVPYEYMYMHAHCGGIFGGTDTFPFTDDSGEISVLHGALATPTAE
jgi:hypothetical protein